MSEPPQEGWIDRQLRDELPGLGVVSRSLAAPAERRSPPGVIAHLDSLALRFRGGDARVLRQRPVPHAYRVFYRHVGLDPDVTRVPIEAAAIERLVAGGFRTQGLLGDALTIALFETGVPLWALDEATVDGPLGLRLSADGEPLGRDEGAIALPAGRIVVADAVGPLAPLFGEPAARHAVTRRTRRLLVFAVRVGGVSAMHVEEALTLCAETLGER
jgi:DNA/RNA-binding domain of Phe-tRNA-synthetase-like protein